MNKRGISAIVATVLIILIIVAAVSILWMVIMPLIKYYLAFEAACMKADQSLSVLDSYKHVSYLNFTKFKDTNGKKGLNVSFMIQIERKEADFNLDDIYLLGQSSTGDSFSTGVSAYYSKAGLPGKNEKRRYVFNVTGNGAVPYLLMTSVKVYPVVRIGGRTKKCDIADETDIFFDQATYDKYPSLKAYIKLFENYIRHYQ